jgi:hypothetical protein
MWPDWNMTKGKGAAEMLSEKEAQRHGLLFSEFWADAICGV